VAAANSGAVQVACRPDDEYDTFIQRFLGTPGVNALWPRTLRDSRT
jgi:hypothetical protein